MPGSELPSDVDAVRTAVSVCAFTTAAIDDDADSMVGSADDVAMTNVLSSFTKSPVALLPQVICAGHVPCVDDEKS